MLARRVLYLIFAVLLTGAAGGGWWLVVHGGGETDVSASGEGGGDGSWWHVDDEEESAGGEDDGEGGEGGEQIVDDAGDLGDGAGDDGESGELAVTGLTAVEAWPPRVQVAGRAEPGEAVSVHVRRPGQESAEDVEVVEATAGDDGEWSATVTYPDPTPGSVAELIVEDSEGRRLSGRVQNTYPALEVEVEVSYDEGGDPQTATFTGRTYPNQEVTAGGRYGGGEATSAEDGSIHLQIPLVGAADADQLSFSVSVSGDDPQAERIRVDVDPPARD